MTKEEFTDKCLLIGGEFDRYVLEHPEVLDRIPDGAAIILLPRDDPEFCEENMKLARQIAERGEVVVYVEIEAIAPQRSRLINPRILETV
jgi:hypothetical protein